MIIAGTGLNERPDDRPCPTCGISPAHLRSQEDKMRGLANKVEELDRKIDELKKRLSYYENSNSPPSKNSLLYRVMKRSRQKERKTGAVVPARPGRKDGHEGVTQIFRPTGSVTHAMERCPRCGSTELSVASTKKTTVVDVPEPLPYTVKEHVINVYQCRNCGTDGLLPESVELPSSSVERKGVILGRNVLSMISMLWSIGRLPQRRVSYALRSMYGLSLSPATVWHALQDVSERLEGFQEGVRNEINGSSRANFDETGVPVAGRRGWIWVAATQTLAMVLVAMSRGRDVLEKHFPEFRGVAMVDGWKPYGYFSLIQRCWAHVLREAEALSLRADGKEEAATLLSSLRSIFHETKSRLQEHPPPNQELHDEMFGRLTALLSSKTYADPDVARFISKLKGASEDLFTFTLYPGVEPTNNHGERQLREPIVHRKIRGQLKSEEGMIMFGRLMTAVSTWKLQGLNPLVEFRRYV